MRMAGMPINVAHNHQHKKVIDVTGSPTNMTIIDVAYARQWMKIDVAHASQYDDNQHNGCGNSANRMRIDVVIVPGKMAFNYQN